MTERKRKELQAGKPIFFRYEVVVRHFPPGAPSDVGCGFEYHLKPQDISPENAERYGITCAYLTHTVAGAGGGNCPFIDPKKDSPKYYRVISCKVIGPLEG